MGIQILCLIGRHALIADTLLWCLTLFAMNTKHRTFFTGFSCCKIRMHSHIFDCKGGHPRHMCLFPLFIDAAKEKKNKQKEKKMRKLVVQGSHMVSSTRCPALSNHLNMWSESRAAALKGRLEVLRANLSHGGLF